MISYPGLKLGIYNPPAFHISPVDNNGTGYSQDQQSPKHTQPKPNPKLVSVCDNIPNRIGTIIDIYV